MLRFQHLVLLVLITFYCGPLLKVGVRLREIMTKIQNGGRWALLAAALGAAWWIEKFVTLEWSYPYCSVMDDGPAGAVFGFPFPYVQASIVTSATEFFIPWLYAINLAAIAAVIFFTLCQVSSRFATSQQRGLTIVAGLAGSILLVTAIAFEALVLLSMDVWRPTSSFYGYPRYSELRPVGVRAFRRQPDCTASPFWFNQSK